MTANLNFYSSGNYTAVSLGFKVENEGVGHKTNIALYYKTPPYLKQYWNMRWALSIVLSIQIHSYALGSPTSVGMGW